MCWGGDDKICVSHHMCHLQTGEEEEESHSERVYHARPHIRT